MGSFIHVAGNDSSGFVPAGTAGKVIPCKAAVLWGPKEPFQIEEILVDPPQKMEVRIKVVCSSICHTDLSAWKGENESQRAFPRILGHEAAGIVESVGEGVTGIGAGDHVVPIFTGECGGCESCCSGKTNLCSRFKVDPLKSVMGGDGRPRFWTPDGKPIYHFINTSTFSEYTVLDWACVVKIGPSAVPLKKMALFSCGISTGVGAAWNAANVQKGSSVAVFGLGAVGLAVAVGARVRGASRIIGIDINPKKFTKGKEMGFTDFLNPNECKESVHKEILKMTAGGVDYSFECVGNVDILREAFLCTHDGWGLTVVLGIHASPRLLPLHPMELFTGRRIVGCVFGDLKGKTQLLEFAQKCIHEGVNLDGFITHELPFCMINEAFQLLAEGESLRCILHL